MLLSNNVTIHSRVTDKRNKIQGRLKTNNKKRLSLGTVLQNKFENRFGKKSPFMLMCYVMGNFCSNIMKPATD